MIITSLFCIVGAYLLGSISTGYYLVRFKTQKDIRNHGSGGVGARNVGRLLGKPGFIVTFCGDAIKGLLAVFLARKFGLTTPAVSLVIVAIIAGNIWPIGMRFRGGRGIATALGAYFAFDPLLALWLPGLTLVLMPLSLGFTLGGLLAFLLFPLVAYLYGYSVNIVVALVAATVIILFSHRARLQRTFSKSIHKKES